MELTVERLDGGEVSTFLHDEVVVGDTLEVRGPIGAWFVWDGSTPALLIGGGSGVVPLMAMLLRLARRQPAQSLVRLVVSARGPAELIYADETRHDDVSVVVTRTTPPDSVRTPGRLTIDDLRPHAGRDRDRVRLRLGRIRRGRKSARHRHRLRGHRDPGRTLRAVWVTSRGGAAHRGHGGAQLPPVHAGPSGRAGHLQARRTDVDEDLAPWTCPGPCLVVEC